VSDAENKAASIKGDRIYAYTNQDGDVFFSFKKMPQLVTPAQNLKLEDRVGTHFEHFVSELRAMRRYILSDKKKKK
jgi:hypothetical protein